jgi:hypothetical protein
MTAEGQSSPTQQVQVRVARYRHTTPEMAVRVAAAIQERLTVVVQVAEGILQMDGSGGRVF